MLLVIPLATGTSQLSWTDVATAIGTVGATTLALGFALRDQIRALFIRPRLTVALRRTPPDCQIITEEHPLQWVGSAGTWGGMPQVLAVPTFYCRLSIGNDGDRRALNVEVRMTRLWRYEAEQSDYVEDRDFLPMNLTWAHAVIGLAVPVIDPHLPRHCNFCHFSQAPDTENALMSFNTEVEPLEVGERRWPTKKSPGKYRAEIAVTAENAKPTYRTLEIEFTGTWSDDPVVIAESGLKVEVTTDRYA